MESYSNSHFVAPLKLFPQNNAHLSWEEKLSFVEILSNRFCCDSCDGMVKFRKCQILPPFPCTESHKIHFGGPYCFKILL